MRRRFRSSRRASTSGAASSVVPIGCGPWHTTTSPKLIAGKATVNSPGKNSRPAFRGRREQVPYPTRARALALHTAGVLHLRQGSSSTRQTSVSCSAPGSRNAARTTRTWSGPCATVRRSWPGAATSTGHYRSFPGQPPSPSTYPRPKAAASRRSVWVSFSCIGRRKATWKKAVTMFRRAAAHVERSRATLEELQLRQGFFEGRAHFYFYLADSPGPTGEARGSPGSQRTRQGAQHCRCTSRGPTQGHPVDECRGEGKTEQRLIDRTIALTNEISATYSTDRVDASARTTAEARGWASRSSCVASSAAAPD